MEASAFVAVGFPYDLVRIVSRQNETKLQGPLHRGIVVIAIAIFSLSPPSMMHFLLTKGFAIGQCFK
jgi:hypothetical protein